MSTPSYDGTYLFGRSVTVVMDQNPTEKQYNTFFGISGVLSLWGGGRGRLFMISGVLTGSDATALAAARALILSYDDGLARVLVDTLGVAWPGVIFDRFQQDGRILQLAGGGLAMPYRASFIGLI
jgi:hypothetical protein